MASHVTTKITGTNVVLRPVEESDIQTALLWRNDPAVRDPQMGFSQPVTTEMEQVWNERARTKNDKSLVLSIDDISDGTHIGFVQINDIDNTSHNAQFGITIGVTARHGRGLGTEATALMLRYAFSELALNRIWLRVPQFNIPAQKLYKKIGFVEEGKLRHHYNIDGKLHDVLIFGILKYEFEF